MSQNQNSYRADLREIRFVLFEQLKFEEVLSQGPYKDWGRDEVEMALTECYNFACEVLGPLNRSGDKEGCQLKDGKVVTPTGFKEAWKRLYEAGWKSISVAPEYGGQGAPQALHAIAEEFLCGANVSFSMYPGLTYGVAGLIEAFATPDQKARYLRKLFDGVYAGTMCLTEPQAGSDVGLARSRATRRPDGLYAISGTKIFISCGDNDFSENIVHMVLARVDGAPAGTKGLSLFIVPNRRVLPDGSLGEENDVRVGSVEHKMGLNGSATCVLNFGENGACLGELVGTVEHAGMRQMFQLMNFARIATGIQGLGVSSSAYLNALEYTRTRKQGASIESWKDPNAPRVPILKHPDIRRMLVDMKARVEGIRALILKLSSHHDRLMVLGTRDEEKVAYHQGQIDLLVPIVKAYGSDQAFRVCETAIQTLGGVGYTKDFPIEQYLRDAKVFSIYEGTNHIQAMDLVGRKLPQAGGANLQRYLDDVGAFVASQKAHPELGEAASLLGAAGSALSETAMRMLGWSGDGRVALIPLGANRFLEMMAETTIGWLLLEGAVIASERTKSLPASHPDKAFYEGKQKTALYFARNVLPEVEAKARILAAEDLSAVEIPEEAFATI